MEVVAAISAACGLIIGVAAALSTIVKPVARALRTIGDMREDWRGEPARDGVPGRPGVMARLAAQERAIDELKAMIAEHLESHRIALAAAGWSVPPGGRHRPANENGYGQAPDPSVWRDHP